MIPQFKNKVAHRSLNWIDSSGHMVARKDEMIQWCRSNFGAAGPSWYYYDYVWRFRFKKDLTAFMLRWA